MAILSCCGLCKSYSRSVIITLLEECCLELPVVNKKNGNSEIMKYLCPRLETGRSGNSRKLILFPVGRILPDQKQMFFTYIIEWPDFAGHFSVLEVYDRDIQVFNGKLLFDQNCIAMRFQLRYESVKTFSTFFSK